MKNRYSEPATPFPTFGYFGPDYFCDRETELKLLLSEFRGNHPTLLLGVRRLGKTGLLHHFIYYLKKSEAGIYVDLQDCSNLREAVVKIAEAVLRTFPDEKKYKVIWSTIKKFRPSISFDEFSGLPQLTLALASEKEAEHSLTGLLDSLSSRSGRTVLIFDEFQQVINFTDMHIESVMRSEMQRHPDLHYIFSGSKTHLLGRIFQEAGRPFYGMVRTIHLDKLDPDIYKKYIVDQFAVNGKKLPAILAEQIVKWTDTHTYYTQYMCSQVFLTSGKVVTENDIVSVKERILKGQVPDFFQIKDLLSAGQWKLLTAISNEGKLFHPNAGDIVRSYDLGNTTAIRKALETLLDKQLIHQAYDEEGRKFYQASNPFLANWIRITFRPKGV